MSENEKTKIVVGDDIILTGNTCSLLMEQDSDVISVARHEIDQLITALLDLKSEMV